MTSSGAADPIGGAAPFPDDFAPGSDRARSVWDMSRLLPMPSRQLNCPVCSGCLAVKDWKFHARNSTGSANPWRCDVRMKCMTCGYVPMFGVLVSEAMYDAAAFVLGSGWIHWRTGRDAMREVSDGSA